METQSYFDSETGVKRLESRIVGDIDPTKILTVHRRVGKKENIWETFIGEN